MIAWQTSRDGCSSGSMGVTVSSDWRRVTSPSASADRRSSRAQGGPPPASVEQALEKVKQLLACVVDKIENPNAAGQVVWGRRATLGGVA